MVSSSVQWCRGAFGGMSKPYYGLILRCARRGCWSAPYVKPHYGFFKRCYGLVIRGAFLASSARGTRGGSEFALEGSKDFGLFAWCARVLWVKTRERPPSVHING